jgi:hypothetical protein
MGGSQVMNVGDILIDFTLLREQYHFLIGKYEIDLGHDVPQDDIEMWEGILNLLETIMDFQKPLDTPPDFVIG